MDANRALVSKVIKSGSVSGLDKVLAAGVKPELFPESDRDIRDAFKFAIRYHGEHGKVPSEKTVEAEVPGVQLEVWDDGIDYILGKWREQQASNILREHVETRIGPASSDPERMSSIPDLLEAAAAEIRTVGLNGHARLRVTSSADVEPEVVEWFWEHGIGWIPSNGLTMVVGDPGEGKGLLGCWLASCATRGAQGVPKVNVGILGHEDSPGIQVGRLQAAGAGEVVFLDTADDDFMTFPTDIGLLRMAIEEFELGLVIVDPINSHVDADIRSSDDKEMRRALSPLNKLGQDIGVTIIAVSHMSKGTVGSKLIYRAGGSIAYVGAARQMLFLGAQADSEEEDYDENARFVFQGKTNYAKKQLSPLKFEIEEQLIEVGDTTAAVPKFVFKGNAEGVSIEDVFMPPRGRGRPKDEGLREWIEEQIAGKTEIESQVLEDAAHAAGRHGSWRTIRNILRQEYHWTAQKVGTRWVWRGRPSPFLKAVPDEEVAS